MATLTKEEILDGIAELSVIQLSELLKDFEEKFGVTAAAPVASSVLIWRPAVMIRLLPVGARFADAPVFVLVPEPDALLPLPLALACRPDNRPRPRQLSAGLRALHRRLSFLAYPLLL